MIKLPRPHWPAERVFHRAVFIEATVTEELHGGFRLDDRLTNVPSSALGGKHSCGLFGEVVAFREDRIFFHGVQQFVADWHASRNRKAIEIDGDFHLLEEHGEISVDSHRQQPPARRLF